MARRSTDPGDAAPAATWTFPRDVDFVSLHVVQTSESEWIRRYRIETSGDGARWTVAVPSKMLDCHHRQPFYEDFLVRAVDEIEHRPDHPHWATSDMYIAAGARPFPGRGFYAPGDSPIFNSLIASIMSPRIAVETERVVVDSVKAFGFLNGGFMSPESARSDTSGTNWIPFCYKDVFAWTRDWGALEAFAGACERWVTWILENRDRDGDGWVEPGLNGCRPSTEEFRRKNAASHPEIAQRSPDYWDYVGLSQDDHHSAFQLAIFELSTDDYPLYVSGRHRGLKFDPATCSLNLHCIDHQLIVSFLCGVVTWANRRLGIPSKADRFRERRTSSRGWWPITAGTNGAASTTTSTGPPASFAPS